MNAAHLFVVDDNEAFRSSSRMLLESLGYRVTAIGDACRAAPAVEAVDADTPCCVLLDVRMPGMSGLDVHDELNRRCPSLPVIYMTGHGDVPLAVAAMRKGALTFLEKPFDVQSLTEALEQALSPEVQARRRSRADVAAVERVRAELATLRRRERQVLELLRTDRTNREMADELCVTVKTIEHHRGRLMRRFGAKNAVQLLTLLIEAERAG